MWGRLYNMHTFLVDHLTTFKLVFFSELLVHSAEGITSLCMFVYVYEYVHSIFKYQCMYMLVCTQACICVLPLYGLCCWHGIEQQQYCIHTCLWMHVHALSHMFTLFLLMHSWIVMMKIQIILLYVQICTYAHTFCA